VGMGQELRENDPLWVQRVILCDVLIGRWMRGNAEKVLRRGLEFEKLARTESFADGWQACVDQELDAAVGIERIAAQSEQGLILWGERFNRRGERPEDCDSSD
jgi:hypothetical protein